jgi:hypothetical protein
MTYLKVINMEIAQFIGPDPDTLRAMGDFCADFKEDVAELLENAIVRVAKMRVMQELLEMANGPEPVPGYELKNLLIGPKWFMSAFEEARVARFYAKRNLWHILCRQCWE